MADFWKAIEALGGGLAAFVMVSLAVVCWRLWLQNSDLQDKRIEDQTSFWERLNGVLKTIETWVASIKDAISAVGSELRALTDQKKELTREVKEMREELKDVLRILRGMREGR